MRRHCEESSEALAKEDDAAIFLFPLLPFMPSLLPLHALVRQGASFQPYLNFDWRLFAEREYFLACDVRKRLTQRHEPVCLDLKRAVYRKVATTRLPEQDTPSRTSHEKLWRQLALAY